MHYNIIPPASITASGQKEKEKEKKRRKTSWFGTEVCAKKHERRKGTVSHRAEDASYHPAGAEKRKKRRVPEGQRRERSSFPSMWSGGGKMQIRVRAERVREWERDKERVEDLGSVKE
jgi:hypothetical protein